MDQNERSELVRSYLGRTVRIEIDRPIGYVHHKEAYDLVYPINYGYIEGVLGGDGEELDVFLLGVDKPVEKAKCRIIAIVRRENTEPSPELPDISGSVQSRVWVKDLERRTREALGRKVKITKNDKKKSIELFYEDDSDMENLLIALCGNDFFAEE